MQGWLRLVLTLVSMSNAERAVVVYDFMLWGFWVGVVSRERDSNPRPGDYKSPALPLSYPGGSVCWSSLQRSYNLLWEGKVPCVVEGVVVGRVCCWNHWVQSARMRSSQSLGASHFWFW